MSRNQALRTTSPIRHAAVNNEPVQSQKQARGFIISPPFQHTFKLKTLSFKQRRVSYLRAQLSAETSGCDKLFPCENVTKKTADLKSLGPQVQIKQSKKRNRRSAGTVRGGEVWPGTVRQSKIQLRDVRSPFGQHAVLKGGWYANSLVKSLKAERLIQQAARLCSGGRRLTPTHTYTRLRFTSAIVPPVVVVGEGNTNSVQQK